MKKVLFLIHTLGAGGAEKVLINLVNNMDKDKYDITLMTVIDTGIFRKDIASHVKYKSMFKLPSNKKEASGSLLNKTSKIKKTLAKGYSLLWRLCPVKLVYKLKIKEKYDVEIAFLEGITAKIISNSPNNDSKKYAWIHVDLLNEKKSEAVFINRNAEKKCYLKFDKIVCVSQIVKENFIKKFDFSIEKVIVKYNIINEREILEKAKEKITDLSFNDSDFKIVSVGRLSKQKAFMRLVNIGNNLKKLGINFKIFIIGVGPLNEQLQNAIIEQKLGKNIFLLGFKSNPYKYMAKCDLFVCSSIAEGFSTVVSEAIVLGMPIITTEVSGAKEMLGENSEYGLITKNNEQDLEQSVIKLINDKKLYEHYKSKILTRKIFNIKDGVKSVEEII